MTLEQALFYLMGLIVVVSAVYVASTKNLVRSIFMFFVTLFAIAGLYVLSLADFVAITQVVIYVGGILVLILFAFMLSGRETLNLLAKQRQRFISLQRLPALLLAALFLIVLVNLALKMHPQNLAWIKHSVEMKGDIKPDTDMTQNIGVNLMTAYLLPFEAISILLLLALVGAAHLTRKEEAV